MVQDQWLDLQVTQILSTKQYKTKRWTKQIQQMTTTTSNSELLSKLKLIPENTKCCDCTGYPSVWAICDIGCFVCIECAAVHRSLNHIVRSVSYDKFKDYEVKTLQQMGNKKVNNIYEATCMQPKPVKNSSTRNDREKFICAKYRAKEWFVQRSDTTNVSDKHNCNNVPNSGDALADYFLNPNNW